MGKGGERAPLSASVASTAHVVPKEKLPSLKEIKESIPKHCFEHSTVKALSHVVRDGLVIAAFAATALTLLRLENLRIVDYVGWAVYAFFQGAALTGWWVLAHECGHGGFSASATLNDAVGFVLHSVLLVPYYSWQYSHGKHHAKTNHLMDGESHNPNSKSDVLEAGYVTLFGTIGEEAFAGFQLFTHLVIGWPIYLLSNASGARRTYDGQSLEGKTLDHFRPSSALFPPSWRNRIAYSSMGIGATLAGLTAAAVKFGPTAVALMYWGPYMWVNFWLVLYTWLQHTKEDVPHYGDGEWTWLRGALCTIDRPYAELGGFFDWMHHHIGSTHVAHHIFSTMPCYNAVEATQHIKAFLAPKNLYNYDPRGTVEAMWQTAKACHYVEATEGIQYPKSVVNLSKDTKKKA